jgi:ABC-type transporter Mla subunit MlaD
MNGEQLARALEGARPDLEAGLKEAEAELAELDARRVELINLIERAKAALGVAPVVTTTEDSSKGQTLHQALAQILRENHNQWMTARELTDEVNRRGLYYKRDGSAVEVNQVHARTKNYGDLFEKNGSRIRLREG